jgi:hypothetical protein
MLKICQTRIPNKHLTSKYMEERNERVPSGYIQSKSSRFLQSHPYVPVAHLKGFGKLPYEWRLKRETLSGRGSERSRPVSRLKRERPFGETVSIGWSTMGDARKAAPSPVHCHFRQNSLRGRSLRFCARPPTSRADIFLETPCDIQTIPESRTEFLRGQVQLTELLLTVTATDRTSAHPRQLLTAWAPRARSPFSGVLRRPTARHQLLPLLPTRTDSDRH